MAHEGTCRVCGSSSGDKIKYGVRHYAHAGCALNKWGAAFFDRLHGWQLENFPVLVADRHNVLDELKRQIHKKRAHA